MVDSKLFVAFRYSFESFSRILNVICCLIPSYFLRGIKFYLYKNMNKYRVFQSMLQQIYFAPSAKHIVQILSIFGTCILITDWPLLSSIASDMRHLLHHPCCSCGPSRVIKYEIFADSDREKHFSNQHGGPLSIASQFNYVQQIVY